MPDSAYLWTAMHVADEKRVAYEHQTLVLNSAEHLKLHPFGKMPVMQHGELYLYETGAIAFYIDRAFDGPSLQPADVAGQANVQRWISIVNAYVFPMMNRFVKERLVRPNWGMASDQVFLAGAREPLLQQMNVIEDTLRRSDFLVGERITLADSFLLPHLLFFSLTPEGRVLLDNAKDTTRWLTRMQGRASYEHNPMAIAFAAFRQAAAPTDLVWQYT